MIVKVLGSAAAEGLPALWCECETCETARRKGGKNLRFRTSYLIDNDTLVDFGPDAFAQSVRFKIDLSKIKRLVFSHAHEDHLNPVDLLWRRNGFSRVSGDIKAFGNAKVMERISRVTGHSSAELKLAPIAIGAGERVADDDLEIFPIEAQHGPADEQALNYVFRRGGKSVLIANDTGWWPEYSWALIGGITLDAAIIECTLGLTPPYIDARDGHLGARAAADFRDALRKLGAIADHTPVFVNHFSHNGQPLQQKLHRFFAPLSIGVAYDGMTVTL